MAGNSSKICMIVCVCFSVRTVLAVSVTGLASDFELDFLPPGSIPGYLAGLNHSGVAGIVVTPFANPQNTEIATGFLLQGESGWWVLTAAHVLDSDGGLPNDVDVEKIVIGFSGLPEPIELVGDNHHIFHPNYLEANTNFTPPGEDFTVDGSFAGFDLALIRLPGPVQGISPYELYRADPDGKEYVIVGRGRTWESATGQLLPFDGKKRFATNKFDKNAIVDEGLDENNQMRTYFRTDTQLVSDFDNGEIEQDATWRLGGAPDKIPTPVGFGLPKEGIGNKGDSGAPGFVRDSDGRWKVAGVMSQLVRIVESDIDGQKNGSWGEANVWTRLFAHNRDVIDQVTPTQERIIHWIDKVLATGVSFLESTGGNMEVASNWAYGDFPTSSLRAYMDEPGEQDYTITGPAGTMAMRSLEIGANPGVRTLELNQGGTLDVNEYIEVNTNGYIKLSKGVVGVYDPDPYFPGTITIGDLYDLGPGVSTQPGRFEWVPPIAGGDSALFAEQVHVLPGGKFEVRVPVGTEQYHMIVDVLKTDAALVPPSGPAIPAGEALIDTSVPFDERFLWIQNNGVLDLGSNVSSSFNNSIRFRDYHQSATGTLKIMVGAESPTALARAAKLAEVDPLDPNGLTEFTVALLAGTLHLSVSGPMFVRTDPIPIIEADLIVGEFDLVLDNRFTGLFPFGGGTFQFDVRYELTGMFGAFEYVGLQMRLEGDANGDWLVNNDDVALVQAAINGNPAAVVAGSFTTGDLNGDGLANQQDISLIYESMWYNLGGGMSLLSMMELDEKTGQIVGIKAEYLSTFEALFPTVQLIPEPGTLALLGIGMLAVGGRRRGG